MSPCQSITGFVLVVISGFLLTLDSSEAGGWSELQQQQQQDALIKQVNNGHQLGQVGGSNSDGLDSDDDEDDDGRAQLQPVSLPPQAEAIAGNNLNQAGHQFVPLMTQQGAAYQPQTSGSGDDLRVAASKHYGHHKHGAKGWLDMGAWTGKKGAFGWHDKHPVGKGK